MNRAFAFFSRAARQLLKRPTNVRKQPKSHDEAIKYRMSRYDMVGNPDEPYYAEQYMYWIKAICGPWLSKYPTILDVGCGQGRLAFSVAQWLPNSRLTGVDLSTEAIAKANEYADELNVRNVQFITSDAQAYVKTVPDASIDLVLFVEVAFWLPNYLDLIREFQRLLRPGGCVVLSFWSQYYRLLKSVQSRQWDNAQLIIGQRQGKLSKNPIVFTWHTPEEVEATLSEFGFKDIHLFGLGTCSGIGEVGDALVGIAQPSQMSKFDREELMRIEIAVAKQYPGNGRYILAFARKSE